MLRDYSILWTFLAASAAAVAVTEWRGRVALANGAARVGSTERYLAGAAIALSRIEAFRVMRHPLAWAGLAITALAIASGSFSLAPLSDFTSMPSFLLFVVYFPLLFGLFAAVHLAVGRDRRTGVDELARTLPVGSRTRTVGHLLASGWVVVPAGILALAALVAMLGPGLTISGYGATRAAGPFELAQPVLAVAIIVAVAVAVGRWWPHPAMAFVVPIVVFFGPMGYGLPMFRWAGPNWYDTFLGYITTAHLAWHAVFLVGFVTFGVAAALLRDDRRPATFALGVVAVAVMVTGYVRMLPGFEWL